jgi:catechol 2,3-dioxygenase-like lactoylglutathione lyase family enzyme
VSVDGFAELTLEVRSLERLERFYVDAFGLTVLKREDDRVWLSAGEHARLGLWLPGEKEFGDEGGRHVHFAFSASPGGLDALAERVGDEGAVVEDARDGADTNTRLARDVGDGRHVSARRCCRRS